MCRISELIEISQRIKQNFKNGRFFRQQTTNQFNFDILLHKFELHSFFIQIQEETEIFCNEDALFHKTYSEFTENFK